MRTPLVAVLTLVASVISGTVAPTKDHIMLGPYEYEESGRKVPRYFLIDDVRCQTQAELKQAAARLPAGSHLVWRRGDADPPSMIEVGFPPITIQAFSDFCSQHQVKFSAIIQR